ncbi:preprotein translocase subunit SecE [Endozoicomonas sp. OPT23]|uniref:preprotein translocase subunit SecE n=1 Tax=Endozoicomonas sp. OPT23 TaxID=2072845 RepID=UPI00129AAAAE|nr:preprotein translocase subunit SecE [Endozoicomonas sp. OPT23]MRI32996.1 preprotein translocase subunit SecE [Endozoicomonas sp. OPT23]
MSGKPEVATEGRLDGLKWALVAILVAAGVAGNTYFTEESVLYRALALVALAVAAGFIGLQTVKGGAFWNLVKEAKVEIRKVVWPTRQETVQTTLVVVAVVVIMGLILWALDSLLGWMISSLIG